MQKILVLVLSYVQYALCRNVVFAKDNHLSLSEVLLFRLDLCCLNIINVSYVTHNFDCLHSRKIIFIVEWSIFLCSSVQLVNRTIDLVRERVNLFYFNQLYGVFTNDWGNLVALQIFWSVYISVMLSVQDAMRV